MEGRLALMILSAYLIDLSSLVVCEFNTDISVVCGFDQNNEMRFVNKRIRSFSIFHKVADHENLVLGSYSSTLRLLKHFGNLQHSKEPICQFPFVGAQPLTEEQIFSWIQDPEKDLNSTQSLYSILPLFFLTYTGS